MPSSVETVIDPAAAFELLGHELRVSICRALFEGEEPVPFSDIRASVGVRDPGHVNYHLTELRPHFVERQGTGYVLQRPGRVAMRLLCEGGLTRQGSVDPHPLGDCVRCGGRCVLHYHDQYAAVTCPDCGHWFVRYGFPPGALADRSADAVASVLDARCRTARRLGNAGVCPLCSGRMDRELGPDDQFGHSAAITYECTRCDCVFDSTVGAALVAHPAVVAFHRRHGVDCQARLWELEFAYDPEALSVLERGPARVAWTVGHEDERLVLEIDSGARVVESRGA